jgi:hypothetical protein
MSSIYSRRRSRVRTLDMLANDHITEVRMALPRTSIHHDAVMLVGTLPTVAGAGKTSPWHASQKHTLDGRSCNSDRSLQSDHH